MGVVEELHHGRDSVVRGAKLKTRKTLIDRALQQLYPLELGSEQKQENTRTEIDKEEGRNLDPEAEEFRPRRNAARVGRQGIQAVLHYEDS